MSRKATAADYGLVGLVGGGGATVLMGMVTLGISAFLGRTPTILIALLLLTTSITVASLAIMIATRSRGDSDVG